MTSDKAPAATDTPLKPRAADVRRQDLVGLFALGLVVGLACRGHFVMPHADFLEFVDSGHALLAGQLPPSLKRAPVFPLLIAGIGRALPLEAGERIVAEWLNVLLLPINGLLVYGIGRRWFGPAARWAAVWFMLLPIGMYCTAHVVVEPLLTFLMLLTVLLAQHGSAWAYAAAAAATMTRYDAAGLIVGVALVDWLRHRAPLIAAGRAGLAAVPLAFWLILTAVNWDRGSGDHYIAQMLEHPTLAVRPMLGIMMHAAVDPGLLPLPTWLLPLERPVYLMLVVVPPLLVLWGLALKLRERDAAMVVAVTAIASYLLVHAAFWFRFDRFGYPTAPLVVLAAGAGLHATGPWFRRFDPRGLVARLVPGFAAVLLLLIVIAAAEPLVPAAAGFSRQTSRTALLGLATIALVWSAPFLLRRERLAQTTLWLAVAALLFAQINNATALLGPGGDLRNNVEAARWIRDNIPPDARVLSASPGLLRLYAGRSPPDRFIGFEQIESTTWPGIVEECRQLRIAYIIWHDQLWQEHGPHYAEQWGLTRFTPLADPDTAPGVTPLRRFLHQPNVVIVRVTGNSFWP